MICLVAISFAIPIVIQSEIRADITTYSDVAGDNVTFENIFEVSMGPAVMFGQPTALSDSINIPTTGFSANASASLDFHQGLIAMDIKADSGSLINSLDVKEFGTYFNFGATSTSMVNTSAFVVADGVVYDANDMFSNVGSGAGNWEQSFSLMFPETQQVRLVVDSQIFALAGPGEVAFINKSGLDVNVGTVSAVPEPEAMTGLASLAIAGLVFARRRRNQLTA